MRKMSISIHEGDAYCPFYKSKYRPEPRSFPGSLLNAPRYPERSSQKLGL